MFQNIKQLLENKSESFGISLATIYLKTNWYFICILQLAGLAKVSNMETILSNQKKNG